jgi:hypothetical protein
MVSGIVDARKRRGRPDRRLLVGRPRPNALPLLMLLMLPLPTLRAAVVFIATGATPRRPLADDSEVDDVEEVFGVIRL